MLQAQPEKDKNQKPKGHSPEKVPDLGARSPGHKQPLWSARLLTSSWHICSPPGLGNPVWSLLWPCIYFPISTHSRQGAWHPTFPHTCTLPRFCQRRARRALPSAGDQPTQGTRSVWLPPQEPSHSDSPSPGFPSGKQRAKSDLLLTSDSNSPTTLTSPGCRHGGRGPCLRPKPRPCPPPRRRRLPQDSAALSPEPGLQVGGDSQTIDAKGHCPQPERGPGPSRGTSTPLRPLTPELPSS